MRKHYQILMPAFLLIILIPAFQACKDTIIERRTYMANVPEYMTYADMRKPIKSESPVAVTKGGKIYIKDHYLFINEKYKGIHVFDNIDPSKPVNLAFYNIPGNVDLAVRGNYLYADSYVDLVVIDLSDIRNPKEVNRLQNIFPYTIPEVEGNYVIKEIDQTKGVITGWKVQKVTVDVENQGNPVWLYDRVSGFAALSSSKDMSSNNGSVNQTIGTGGSLARFIIYDDQFYALNDWNMQVLDISTPDMPKTGSLINLNRRAETVFIEGGNLFIGTQTGMLIYSLTDPSNPAKLSEFNHFQSCDPVVAQDNLAYVTMRSGNRCGSIQNQMDVLDISSVTDPKLIKSYQLTEPYGLGIDNKVLFVCDGSAGLKIYDATDPLHIDDHLIKIYTEHKANDVIPLNGLLIMIADDGLYEFDYSNLPKLVLLSKIPLGS
jgi:hypothetical protein